MTPESYLAIAKSALFPARKKVYARAAIVLFGSCAFSLLFFQLAPEGIGHFVGGLFVGLGVGGAAALHGLVRGQMQQLAKFSGDPANAKLFVSKVTTIDEDGLWTNFASGARSHASWSLIVGWRELDGYYRLHYSRVYFYILPSDAFDSSGNEFLRSQLAKIPHLADVQGQRR